MNYQSHDLGLDPLLQGDDEIKEAVQELGSQIDLMMITDYMDESMVLLKVRRIFIMVQKKYKFFMLTVLRRSD